MIIAILVLSLAIGLGCIHISTLLIKTEQSTTLFGLEGSPVVKARGWLALVWIGNLAVFILVLIQLIEGHL